MPLQQPAVGRRSRAGVTLLEVLVAVLLLTVGLLALAASAGHFARALAEGDAVGRATRLARAALERERARPCAGAGSQPVEATVPFRRRTGAGGTGFITLRTAFLCPR